MVSMAAADHPSRRRSSFRKSLTEADLPETYLEQLEQKRRQLDDSIHKYVASKEREYKSYERDLKLRHSRAVEESNGGRSEGPVGGNAPAKRRTSSESTLDAGDHAAIETLLANSSRRASSNGNVIADGQGQPSRETQDLAAARAGDRRTSIERDKDFVGLFTPPFLPALQDKEEKPPLDRHSSAPSVVGSVPTKTEEHVFPRGMDRANSDTAVQAKAKRPAHLQLSQRTSSSGSSVDGRLISALKSPTDAMRPKRKRVSLAVGDEIVAPSDSVPATQRMNSTPSHSRVRWPIPEPQKLVEDETPKDGSIPKIGKHPPRSSVADVARSVGRVGIKDMPPAAASASIPGQQSPQKEHSPNNLDADGDLFDLEEADVEPFPEIPDMDFQDSNDPENEITGRIGTSPPTDTPALPPVPTEQSPAPVPQTGPSSVSPEGEGTTTAAMPASSFPVSLSFNPKSAAQPSKHASAGQVAAGFRRPSVAADPIVSGAEIESARRLSDEAGASFYGSSFNKPTTKASFTGGSLGESYMVRHAEEMSRRREERLKG